MIHSQLSAWSTAKLLATAREIRDRSNPLRTLTYSPKVFIPLTRLCRDRCGYCTFAEPPARRETPYLSAEEVLEIATMGQRFGCREALFTLGERPEDRYEVARAWLNDNGYDSTVHYLAEMCGQVLRETGLLPHANAGALHREELQALRACCPSQGMMIESLNPDLKAHRNCPDKDPQRRLDTLRAAGELSIPFTTGILVGIGESEQDRITALEAIADMHDQYGHVQEVIVQNFLPKPRTAMADDPECDSVAFQRAIALARIIMPATVHIQAPPNLTVDYGTLISAGIDDWGGVSPVTADHVNPERPWPALEELSRVTEEHGFALAPRLTIYPEFASAPQRWCDPAVRSAVLHLSDATGLARDWDVARLDDQPWYSGSDGQPPVLIPALSAGIHRHAVDDIIEDHRRGVTLDEAAIVDLFAARGPQFAAVIEYADQLRAQVAGPTVTWVHNRNINYTNVCTFKCKFCGFSKGPLSLNLRGTPYVLSLDDIADRAEEAVRLGATEVCLQGGIHPDFDGDYYLDVATAVHQRCPDLHIHGFTALEVHEGARRSGTSLFEYLSALRDAGLRTLPGTAAEILDDEVRSELCADKVSTEEWLETHRTAHAVGLRSNITIMFGSIESPVSWARHLIRTRDLQAETGGFTEFVPLPFVHMASPVFLQGHSRRGPTFREAVLMHAVGRIVYHGLIDNIQASWVKMGASGVRQLLQAGANDLGGTLINENISRAAGATHGQEMNRGGFEAMIEGLDRVLCQRTTLYELLNTANSSIRVH